MNLSVKRGHAESLRNYCLEAAIIVKLLGLTSGGAWVSRHLTCHPERSEDHEKEKAAWREVKGIASDYSSGLEEDILPLKQIQYFFNTC